MVDLFRISFGIATLGFVLVTHMIGFNNVRVMGFFWMPELVLLVYVLYTLIPLETVSGWYKKLKTFYYAKRKDKKVVKLKSKKRKKLSLPVILDGILIAAVTGLSLYLFYRI